MSQQEDDENNSIQHIRDDIAKATPSFRRRALEAFGMAALGSIPWVGGFIAAAASLKLDEDEIERDNLQTRWLEEHKNKLDRLQQTFNYIFERFDNLGDEIDERLQSEEYLDIVRKAFRVWDRADTDEKRKYVADLIANASATSLTSDDVVRLFIDWLDNYHEAHFAVVKEIYQHPGSTRQDIWEAIYGKFPQENSAEADLYKMLIRDLSTVGIIRQERDVTPDGQFLKKKRPKHSSSSKVMISAFEDTKPYVLTELGKQFVHYTMTELVPRVGPSEEG